MAAVLACGDGAVLSHGSAASLWAIREGEGPLPDVTVDKMNNFALAFMLRPEEFSQLFAALAGGKRLAVRELQAQLAPARHGALLRGLGWLAKGGVIRICKG